MGAYRCLLFYSVGRYEHTWCIPSLRKRHRWGCPDHAIAHHHLPIDADTATGTAAFGRSSCGIFLGVALHLLFQWQRLISRVSFHRLLTPQSFEIGTLPTNAREATVVLLFAPPMPKDFAAHTCVSFFFPNLSHSYRTVPSRKAIL